MNNARKDLDKMTKTELKFELEELRDECEMFILKEEINKMVNRMVISSDLKKIKNFVEKVYKESIAGDWGFLYGMRDNIHDMADNLAAKYNSEELQYFSHFMYYSLLDKAPDAIQGLHTITPEMERHYLKKMLEEKDGIA